MEKTTPSVQVISAWSVKTRRAPPRRCRDARVYGLTDYGHAKILLHLSPLYSHLAVVRAEGRHVVIAREEAILQSEVTKLSLRGIRAQPYQVPLP